jgi:16S rRNA (guanine1516-N2)-methyltransferase
MNEVARSRACVLLDGEDSQIRVRAADLAHTLKLPLHDPKAAAGFEVVLAYGADGLELRAGEAPARRGVRVEFRSRSVTEGSRRRAGHAAASQPLIRAIGRKRGRVLDATAGFGNDAILLASLGHTVTAVDRSPIVTALLEDGRRRALGEADLRPVAERLSVRCADSRTLLKSLVEQPDVVYIDPMYPRRRHASALPRLQMQLLRKLVGEDSDADELLAAALTSTARRVVVKRPPKAPVLGGTPSSSHEGKLVRYDVYQGEGREGR